MTLPLPLPEEVSPLSLEDRLNALICTNRSVAGYAIVQPNGSVLVAFGCLYDNDDNTDDDNNDNNDPSDVVNALLIDQTRTTLTLRRRKMHVVRRAPDMLLAVEALSLDGTRHPVACSAHSISGNNILLVAYGPGGSHEALPLVLSCLHAPPQA